MKVVYDPLNKIEKAIDRDPEGEEQHDSVEIDLVIKEVEDGLFHIGDYGDELPASTVVCLVCGGNTFNVGRACYYTAIRCTKCEYEIEIDSG